MAGAFGYAMYRWQTSPPDTMRRIVTSTQDYLFPEAPLEPEAETELAPEETPARPRQALPRPDALAWLLEHKEQWPNEVRLLEPADFPAVSGGKTVGSLKVPAGSVVKVLEITKQDLAVDYLGGTGRVPIGSTDLLARAETALTHFERDSKRTASAAASATPSARGLRCAAPR